MKNIILLVTLAALTSCSGSSSGNGSGPIKQNSGEIQNANPGAGFISVMGDSLAYGTGATDDNVKPAGCLAQLPNTGIKVTAVPGYTSTRIYDTLTQTFAPNPKLIFVSSGGNDTMIDENHPGEYPESKTLMEMTALFDRLIEQNNVVAYLALNPPVPYSTRLPKISELAKSKGVIVIDGMNELWTDPTMMADQIHPNNAGYAIMCNRILSAITPYYP
jgi:lysophospholipase L1-like esterase